MGGFGVYGGIFLPTLDIRTDAIFSLPIANTLLPLRNQKGQNSANILREEFDNHGVSPLSLKITVLFRSSHPQQSNREVPC